VHVADPRHEKSGGNRRVEDLLNYFRVIAGADENVGRLLKALDEAGLSEDTMVIYASDNGYHLGEHGIGDKRSAYEVSMRVPLLVRYPRLGRTGTVDGMALNIDLAPTMLDFAGVPVPPEMQGRSWRPLLEGRAARIRDAFLYEYFFSYKDITDYEIQTANCPITPTIAAVRTETAKLIKYPERDWVELFDLARDPHERDNLAALPEHAQLRDEMERLHAREMKAVGFRYPPGYQPPPVEGLEEWRR
jgi:arylsulfatase A-like enzyme